MGVWEGGGGDLIYPANSLDFTYLSVETDCLCYCWYMPLLLIEFEGSVQDWQSFSCFLIARVLSCIVHAF